MMRDQPGSALYSLGEREVKIFSVGLTALLVLTFGAGMLVGTFWTGPVVERARREAEEEMRLASAAASQGVSAAAAVPSAEDLVAAPSSEPAAPEIETEPVSATDTATAQAASDAWSEDAAPLAPEPYRAETYRAEPSPLRPRPSWRRTEVPVDRPLDPEPTPRAVPELPPATVPELIASAVPPAPQGVYALQLGIFSVESNASAMRARLAARGYEPYQVEERRSLGGVAKTLYSVRVGGFSTYGEAQQQATELRANAGLEVMIRRPEG